MWIASLLNHLSAAFRSDVTVVRQTLYCAKVWLVNDGRKRIWNTVCDSLLPITHHTRTQFNVRICAVLQTFRNPGFKAGLRFLWWKWGKLLFDSLSASADSFLQMTLTSGYPKDGTDSPRHTPLAFWVAENGWNFCYFFFPLMPWLLLLTSVLLVAIVDGKREKGPMDEQKPAASLRAAAEDPFWKTHYRKKVPLLSSIFAGLLYDPSFCCCSCYQRKKKKKIGTGRDIEILSQAKKECLPFSPPLPPSSHTLCPVATTISLSQ